MKKAEVLELQNLLNQLVTTMDSINETWSVNFDVVNDALEDEYPFNSSFDELACDVRNWVDSATHKLGLELEYKKLAINDFINSRETFEVNYENVDELADRGLFYEDIHSDTYDGVKVHFYLHHFYILESRNLVTNEVTFNVTVERSDYECKTLKEAETVAFEEFMFDEHYNMDDVRKSLAEKKAIDDFVDKLD